MPAIAAAQVPPPSVPRPVAPGRPAGAPKAIVRSLEAEAAGEAPSEFARTLNGALSEDATAAGGSDAGIDGTPVEAKPQGDAKVVGGTARIVDETAAGEVAAASEDGATPLEWMTLPGATAAAPDATLPEPMLSETEAEVADDDEGATADGTDVLSGVASVTIAAPPQPVADAGPQAMPMQRVVSGTAEVPEAATPAARSGSGTPPPEIEIPGESADEQLGIETDLVSADRDPFSGASERAAMPAIERTFDSVLAAAVPQPSEPPAGPTASPTAPAAPDAPDSAFVDENHPRIVRDVRAALSADGGGTMEIRLDPPELGALSVKVEMRDGLITASFQTSSDEATRLLGHSLAQLKHSLESAGVSVDRLQVQQAPRQEFAQQQFDRDARDQQQQASQDNTRHEQQRREMLQRMWQRLRNNGDPVDLFA